ncbi:hypothetical protein M569_15879, partial [Genlisea aurea]
WLKALYVVLAFCSVLFFGAIKSLIIGPIAGSIVVFGNLGIILGLFPAHVSWTVYTIIKTNRFDIPLKIAILACLPALFVIWLALGIAGTVLVGIGYGFFTPWIASFEAFRHENGSSILFHSIADGTWETIKGSCTVVRDFADLCLHSYPLCLKDIRENSSSNDLQPLR